MNGIPERSIGRSIWAVVAGFVVVVVLSTATDAVLHKAGVFPAVGERMARHSTRSFTTGTSRSMYQNETTVNRTCRIFVSFS